MSDGDEDGGARTMPRECRGNVEQSKNHKTQTYKDANLARALQERMWNLHFRMKPSSIKTSISSKQSKEDWSITPPPWSESNRHYGSSLSLSFQINPYFICDNGQHQQWEGQTKRRKFSFWTDMVMTPLLLSIIFRLLSAVCPRIVYTLVILLSTSRCLSFLIILSSFNSIN